jgi:hypothetical protein
MQFPPKNELPIRYKPEYCMQWFANVPGVDPSLSALLPYSTQGAMLPRRPCTIEKRK